MFAGLRYLQLLYAIAPDLVLGSVDHVIAVDEPLDLRPGATDQSATELGAVALSHHQGLGLEREHRSEVALWMAVHSIMGLMAL